MRIDLDRDLRTYVSYLDSVTASAVKPIEPDEILAAGDRVLFLDTETDRQTPLSQHRRGLWVAVAAVVTIFVFVGLFPLLTNGDSKAVGTLDPTTVRPFVVGLVGPNDVVFDPSSGLFISDHVGVGSAGLRSSRTEQLASWWWLRPCLMNSRDWRWTTTGSSISATRTPCSESPTRT